MLVLEHTVRIYRPIADVFAYVADSTNDMGWASAVLEVEPLSEGPPRVGAVYRTVGKFLGRRVETQRTLTLFEADRRVCWEGTQGPLRFSECRLVQPVEDDTLLTRRVEAEVGGFFGMAEPLVHGAAQRQIETDLMLLKTLLDARAEPRDGVPS